MASLSLLGGALIAASVKILLDKIVAGEFIDFVQSWKLDVTLLEKLKITLLSLQAVLHDAEDKQITNPNVKEWLHRLQGAVFEAEDLFDQINTKALKCKVEPDQVRKKLSYTFKNFNRKINSKLQKLLETLELLRNQNLGLKEGVSGSVWYVTPTTSVPVDESDIYSRDDDNKKLVIYRV